MNTYQMPKKIVVHAPVPFHSDDVMCVAMAKRLNPDVVVEFNNSPSLEDIADEGKTGIYVADVGRGRFDHHQMDAKVREDGNKYAACGLLYEVWKDKLFPDIFPNNMDLQKYFEEVYIKPIEQADNGIAQNTLSSAIGLFNPEWNDKETDPKLKFFEAVDFTDHFLAGIQARLGKDIEKKPQKIDEKIREISKNINKNWPYQDINNNNLLNYALQHDFYEDKDLTKTIAIEILMDNYYNNYEAGMEAIKIVESVYKKTPNKEIIVFDRCLPWHEALCPTDAKFAIYPSARGGYNLQCVTINPESFENKISLPQKWLGEKPVGCTFVHPAKFLAAFDTAEQAYKAAENVLDLYKEKSPVDKLVEDVKELSKTKETKEVIKPIKDKDKRKSLIDD